MEDISIYFEPITSDVESFEDEQWGSKVHAHFDKHFPEIEPGGLALFSVASDESSKVKTEQIRKSFYQLYADQECTLYDLGIINQGATGADQFFAIRDCMATLLKNNVLPIVLTDQDEILFELYRAYESMEQIINLSNVAPFIDFSNHQEDTLLSKIFTYQPGFLFNYSHLGYQNYYTNPNNVTYIEEMYFDTMRLGELRSDLTKVEPYLRNTDLLFINCDAIRKSDFESNRLSAPNGFTGEDICSITRYAGIADKLTHLALLINSDLTEADSVLVAQMLWHFIEGYDQRKGDYPIGSKNGYTKFHVAVKEFQDQIQFYKSNKSSRWWMEVPYPGHRNKKFERHYLVPCTVDDYELSLKDELPDLWWKTYQKLT